jgi:hypothetical protein
VSAQPDILRIRRGNIFKVQDQIAAATVKVLWTSPPGGAMLQTVKAPTTEAYSVFLLGRARCTLILALVLLPQCSWGEQTPGQGTGKHGCR